MQCPEQALACTGVGAVGCVPLGRSRRPLRIRNWDWRASWSKIPSPTLIPSHIDGGDVCQSGGGDGGGGDGGGGGDVWGPWAGGCVACGAGLGAHSGTAAGLPQTPKGRGS